MLHFKWWWRCSCLAYEPHESSKSQENPLSKGLTSIVAPSRGLNCGHLGLGLKDIFQTKNRKKKKKSFWIVYTPLNWQLPIILVVD